MVDAAVKADVKLFIYAGLPCYEQITGGKVSGKLYREPQSIYANKPIPHQFTNVDHFDGKAEVENYAKQHGINYVSVQPAMYVSLRHSSMWAGR